MSRFDLRFNGLVVLWAGMAILAAILFLA